MAPRFQSQFTISSLRLLETLIIDLLQPGAQYRGSDPNLQLIAELALANQRELKTFLGLTIVESDTPIKIVQKLLSILGLKLTCIGRLGSRGDRERVYVYDPPLDGREEIFANWLQRDRASEQSESAMSSHLSSVSTIGKDNNLSPELDMGTEKDREQKRKTIKPGAVVEWLQNQGQWIVQATTGMIAKIRDTYGKEVLVNCQELKLCPE